jgi:hypothetical protein
MFVARTMARLENAAQHGNVFPMPPVPAGVPGWRPSILQSLMAPGQSVLVPRGATPPDSSVTELRSETRDAFDYYMLTQKEHAFRGLTPEGREFALSAVVVLLDNVRQPAGTPGRLEASEIPAALRLIDDAAKRMGQPPAAVSPGVVTQPIEPPKRLSFDQFRTRVAPSVILQELNSRRGNAPGLLDANSWRDIAAIVPPSLRRQVVEKAFAQYRSVLRNAFGRADWSAVSGKVLSTLEHITLLAAERPQVFERAVDPMELRQALWQQRLMGFVRFHQAQIDFGATRAGRPLSDWQRAELRSHVRTERANVLRGIDRPPMPGFEGAQTISQAVAQLDRLLEQLSH